jgi:tripartite-type tricarboxylate transporter receptor subunit TctC
MITRRTLALAGAALPFAAQAQSDYPSRPITMVVAFPPAGRRTSRRARPRPAMERVLRQPVVVQNRGGAAGAIGNAFRRRSAPDGYTLLMALSSLAVIPEARSCSARTPPYTVDQFAPIALVNADPTMLAVPASRPGDDGGVHRRGEGTARRHPLRLLRHLRHAACRDGDAGHRGRHPLPARALLRRGPGDHGAAPGQIQALASAPGTLTQHAREGRVRVLACWGRERVAAFPDVPTFMERGSRMWSSTSGPVSSPPRRRRSR